MNRMSLLSRTVRALAARYNNRACFSSLPPEVVVFMDDNTVVCWHPEQEFPYEYSKPLPEVKCESNSALKIGEKEIAAVFKVTKPELVVNELAKITYTTKHRWYPRTRDKRAKKTEPDRRYL